MSVSVACLNFLFRMPRHRLLAFGAARPWDGIAHWVLHYLQETISNARPVPAQPHTLPRRSSMNVKDVD